MGKTPYHDGVPEAGNVAGDAVPTAMCRVMGLGRLYRVGPHLGGRLCALVDCTNLPQLPYLCSQQKTEYMFESE